MFKLRNKENIYFSLYDGGKSHGPGGELIFFFSVATYVYVVLPLIKETK